MILSSTIVLSPNCVDKHLADTLCTHLNSLYLVAFLVDLVNLRSFYMVHGNHDVFTITGYKVTLVLTSLVFALLVIIIHEERYRPLYLMSKSVN